MYNQTKLFDFDIEMPNPTPPKVFKFDLAGLIEWLETPHPEMTYTWFSCNECLLARFREACGGPKAYPYYLIDQAMVHVASAAPSTYGEALYRAKHWHAMG
jgi:hypothetical protein